MSRRAGIEAAEWAVRRAGGLNQAEVQELDSWLRAPGHAEALAEAARGLSFLEPRHDPAAQAAARQMVGRARQRGRVRRRRRLAVAATAAGLAALAFIFLPIRREPAPIATAYVVRPLVQTLADGTAVELNARAEIVPEYSSKMRAVRLLKGEAHFAVAKESRRPFVVTAGVVKVQAVGTTFNVRLGDEAIEVLVTEGRVRISQDTGGGEGSAPAELDPGERAVFALHSTSSAPAISPVAPATVQRDLAWRERRFEFSDATLEEAIALFNRAGAPRLSIGDPALKTKRISGIFWIDDPDTFAELAASTLELVVGRGSDGTLVFLGR